MGNSASALPYKIGEETHPSTRPGSYGFAIHNGNRKSDHLPVTVFKASKSALAQTPLVKGSTTHDPSLTQIFPALHHFQKTKTLIHPNILKVYATLDTDFPNDGKDSGSGGGGSSSSSIMSPSSSVMSYGSSSSTAKSQISTDSITNQSTLRSALEQMPTTGDLIIVTEPVIPLSDYLDNLQYDDSFTDAQRANAVSWGIYNVINAITFLHSHAKVAHGNISPSAIYVTPSGDFKLSTLQLLTPIGIADGASGPTPHFRHFERDVTNNLYRCPERIEGRWDAISTSAVHVMDAYSLGVLLPEIYAHIGCGTNGKLPMKLEKACKRLSSSSMAGRPRIGPLVRCPVFDNEYIKTLSFLDTLATQDVESKIVFWKSLPDLLNINNKNGTGTNSNSSKQVLSSRVAKYKILPILQSTIVQLTTVDNGLTQDVHKRECLALLPTLFSTSTSYLTPEEFQTQLSPVVELLFRVNDRAVRGSLLSRITLFAKLLDGPTLNRVVFEPMCSGFSDSSAPLRELTLKSSIVLVEHLTPANLEKLTRYLVRLQGDAEDSIRTNTVIFIGKVAPNLSHMARSKLILPAFMRAMGDGFVPCRLAGLKAIRACRDYFEEKKLATDVLPAIAPSLVDSNEDVRMESMKVVEELLEILRDVGDRLSEEERARALMEGNTGTSAGTASSFTHTAGSSTSSLGKMAGIGPNSQTDTAAAATSGTSTSYMSSFSSWASSKITSSSTTTAKPTAEPNSTTAPAPSATPSHSSSSYTATASKPAPKFSSLSLRDAGVGGENAWSNDDDDFGDLDSDTPEKGGNNNNNNNLIPSWASENDNNDFMSQFEKKDFVRPRSAAGVGGSKLNTPSRVTASSRRRAELVQKKNKETKVSVTKLTMDNSLDDGWEDF